MSNVLNRTTKQYRASVHTPDYPVPEWIINPVGSAALVAQGIPSTEWVVNPDDSVREMNAAEKETALLLKRKMEKIVGFKDALTGYMAGKYDPPAQVTLNSLWNEANTKGFVNRKNSLKAVMDWFRLVLSEFYTKKNAVLAATTLAQVEAVQVDYAQFNGSFPDTPVESIFNLVD